MVSDRISVLIDGHNKAGMIIKEMYDLQHVWPTAHQNATVITKAFSKNSKQVLLFELPSMLSIEVLYPNDYSLPLLNVLDKTFIPVLL